MLDATLESMGDIRAASGGPAHAIQLARAASGEARASYANYFNSIGKPGVAASLLGGTAAGYS